jgi:formylmethanofuran dehydrogenase subunit A
MFAVPARVYKGGELVAEDGEIRARPRGQTLAAPIPPA